MPISPTSGTINTILPPVHGLPPAQQLLDANRNIKQSGKGARHKGAGARIRNAASVLLHWKPRAVSRSALATKADVQSPPRAPEPRLTARIHIRAASGQVKAESGVPAATATAMAAAAAGAGAGAPATAAAGTESVRDLATAIPRRDHAKAGHAGTQAKADHAGTRPKTDHAGIQAKADCAGTQAKANHTSTHAGATGEMPPLTERLAEKVAALVASGKPSKQAQAYLRALNAQQGRAFDAESSRLVGALIQYACGAQADVPSLEQVKRTALKATEAMLLHDYLRHDGREIDPRTVDLYLLRAIEGLPPEKLVSLHKGLVAAARADTVQGGAEGFYLGMTTANAARNAWAVGAICDRVGKSLGFHELRSILRGYASRQAAAYANEAAFDVVVGKLNSLPLEHYHSVLMRQLRARTRAQLDKGSIPVNRLAPLAAPDVPDPVYAGRIAQALQSVSRRGSDVQVRARMETLLEELSEAEIRGMSANLLTGASAPREHMRYLKRLVEDHAADTAGAADLGRRFTILCEILADRLGGESAPPALDALHAWDWDQRLSGSAVEVPRPGRLRRGGIALYRGMRRFVISLFDPDKADRHRARDARRDLVDAACDFAKVVSRGQEPGESEARVRTAGARYEAACAALGEGWCKRFGLPMIPDKFYEEAFRAALARTRGARVDRLGIAFGDRSASLPHSDPAETDTPMSYLRRAVKAEPAIRASAEILRAVDRYVDGQASVSVAGAIDGSGIAAGADVARADIGGNGGTADDAGATSGAGTAGVPPADERGQHPLLNEIWALDSRFRPRDHAVGYAADGSRERFVAAGMQRLSPVERQRLEDAVCDVERQWPAWLANDEIWLSIVRNYAGLRVPQAL
jgi:hypothetical protein